MEGVVNFDLSTINMEWLVDRKKMLMKYFWTRILYSNPPAWQQGLRIKPFRCYIKDEVTNGQNSKRKEKH